MQSIRITLFSAKPIIPRYINVPILSYEDLVQRVESIAGRHLWISSGMAQQSCVDCRELFQEKASELFFFPSSSGRSVSLEKMSAGEVFFLKHSSSWSFILCFNPHVTAISHGISKASTSFSEEQGYPAGVDDASSFFFLQNHMSILVSEHGCLTINTHGELVLKGIDVIFLQKMRFRKKSIFMQRKNECVSPNRLLIEGIETFSPIQKYKKYIKIRCVCKAPGFCYSAQFPVLSEKELEQEIEKDRASRIQVYGSRSHLASSKVLKYCIFQAPSTVTKHMIIFSYRMGIDVPFGACEGGRMFFSADTASSECSPGSCKLTFFPKFFDPNKNIQVHMGQSMKKNFEKSSQNAVSVCGATKVTTFMPSGISLIPVSSSEYQVVGATVEMLATKNYGGWAVCFSRETINLSNSPIPGPSGLGNRKPTTQATATVSVPPERQGKQTQKKRKSSVPGPSGVRNQVICPTPFCTQAASTASVSTGRQSQQTPQTQQGDIRNSSLGPSGVRHHPYPKHGPWPFSGGSHHFYPGKGFFIGGFYPYGSPYPPYPHPSARQDQLMPFLPLSASAVRPFAAALELLRYNISVEERLEHSGRAEEASASIPVGAVQQTPIWRPDEESSSAPPQAQAENFDEDTDIDVEN